MLFTIRRRILDIEGKDVYIGEGLTESAEALIFHTKEEAEEIFYNLELEHYWEILTYAPAVN